MNMPSTMGDSSSTSVFRKNVHNSKRPAVSSVKAMADLPEILPVTIPHCFFRGFETSYFLPIILFIDIPVALARVPARITRMITLTPGNPPAAMNEPATMNGISNTVCSSFM